MYGFPLRTRVLTRRGWLNHDQVVVGDETIGYNTLTRRSEWTTVTRVLRLPVGPVLGIGNQFWSAECAPGQRWLMEDIHVVSSYSPRPAHRRLGSHEVIRGEGFVALEAMTARHRLVLAREADTGPGFPITIQEAAILGWLMGDGSIYRARGEPVDVCCVCGWRPSAAVRYPSRSIGTHRRKRHGIQGRQRTLTHTLGWTAHIIQAKPAGVAKLRSLLSDVPHSEFSSGTTQPGRLPRFDFYLHRAYSTDLLNRTRWADLDPVGIVLALSAEQRAAWLAAMIDAEGTVEQGKTTIYQSEGPTADAIELAIYLCGTRPGRSRIDRPRARAELAIRLTRPYVAGPRRRYFSTAVSDQAVWCVATGLRSWTANQDGRVFLTG